MGSEDAGGAAGSLMNYRALLHSLQDPAYLCDLQGNVDSVNPAAEGLSGPLHSLRSLRSWELFGRNCAVSFERAILEGSSPPAHTYVMDGKGMAVEVEQSIVLLGSPKSAHGLLILQRLISGDRSRRSDRLSLEEDFGGRIKGSDLFSDVEDLWYRAACQASSEMVCFFQSDSRRLLDSNLAFQEKLEYGAEDILCLTVYDFVDMDRTWIDEFIEEALLSGHTAYQEMSYRTRDGSTLEVEAALCLIPSSDGSVLCLIGRMVAESKRSLEELKRRDRLLAGVALATNQILGGSELDTAIVQALELLAYAAEVDRVYIFENQHDTGPEASLASLRYKWEREGYEKMVVGEVIRYHDVPRWRSRLPVHRPIHGTVEEMPVEEKEILSGRGAISVLIFPIHIDGRFWGFIGFDDCSRGRQWSWTEVSILLAAGGCIGGALARQQFHGSLVRNDERYRQILEDDGTILVRIDPKGRITFMNDQARSYFGFSSEEFLGKDIVDTILADREWWEPLIRALLDRIVDGPDVFDQPLLESTRKSCQKAWVSWAFRPIRNERQNVTEILLVGIDIAEGRMVRDKLKEANRKLLDIIDFLPDASFVVDEGGRVVAWNRAIEDLTNVPKSQILGKSDYSYAVPFYGSPRPMIIDLVRSQDPALRSYLSPQYEVLEHNGRTVYAEIFAPRLRGGEGAYLLARSSPLMDGEGRIVGAVESIRDITDQKKASDELIKRDRLLAGSALAASSLLTAGDYSSAIKEALQVLGLVCNADRAYVYENHKSDRGHLKTDLRFEWSREGDSDEAKNLSGRSVSDCQELPEWYQILGSGKLIKGLVKDFLPSEQAGLAPPGTLSVLIVPIMVEDLFWGFIGLDDCHRERLWNEGEVSLLIGFAGSVGGSILRKRAEDRLRLFESAIVNSNDAVVIAAAGQRGALPKIVYVNDAFTRMAGYGAEEALGRHPDFLERRESSDIDADGMSETKFCGFPVHTEVVKYHKDGTSFWVELNIVPLKDEHGEVTHWVSIERETTERRRAEERLRWNDTLMRSMTDNSYLSFCVVDTRTDDVVYFNHHFCQLWGLQDIEDRLSRSEIKNTDVLERIARMVQDPQLLLESCRMLGEESNTAILEDEILFLDGRIVRRFSAQVRDQAGRYFGRLFIFEDITKRKLEEQELIETRNYLENLINYANAPIIVWDVTFSITRFNRAFERLTGYGASEVLGQNLSMLFPEMTRTPSLDEIERTLDGEYWDSVEIPVLRKDGQVRVVLWNSANIYSKSDGVLLATMAQGTDITDRKKAEEQVQFQASLLSQVRNAIVATDMDGRIIYWNKFAEMLYQWTWDEVLGRNILEILVPDNKSQLVSGVMRSIYETGHLEGEYLVRRRDGSVFLAYFVYSLITGSERQPVGFLGVSTDITERVRFEEELRRAKDEAEVAARAKSEFLANMSHEIRTPLNAIIGMTGLLMETDLDQEQWNYVKTVRSSGDALLEIVGDILDFSKAEGGKLELESHPFDLRECVEASLDLVSAKAAEKDLDLSYFMHPGVPESLIGDVTRLRQVLVNLLSNAVKFTEIGEVRVDVTSAPIPEGDCEITISVTDTGVGIPKDLMFKLFKSFSQVDTSITRRYGGTGLGLAISKYLVELMGGRIWAESEVGKGSIFHFSFVSRPAAGPGRQISPSSVLDGKKVLVMESSPAIRSIISSYLRSWHMIPVEVASPEEAENALSLGTYQIAIIDLKMPERKARSLAETVKSAYPDAYLVGVSSIYPRDLDIDTPYDAIITKPVKPAQLHEALTGLFWPKPLQTDNGSSKARPSRPSLRILLAEDNVVNQKVALMMLERLGYRADVAANGLEVLNALQRQKYDLILMDVQMPEMDGLEATRRIRKLTPQSGPFIAAITAYAMEGDRERCLRAGMDDYISKPIKLEELKRVVRQSARLEEPQPLDPVALASLRELQEEGEPDIVKELANIFLGHSPGRIAEMRRAVEAGDSEALFREAHNMKSSSASMGALRLSGICKDLELLSKSGSLDGAAEKMRELEGEYERVKAALTSLLSG
ncbi:MAG: Bacterioopsin transcriptional activator [Methanosaeta sp. PtaB.Bin039]|nr:MAG: Bacterioopsin transcriptional activator [Methanosaeta sp. PtaB.Bin039]